MNHDQWHEQIQRHMNGRASAEEAAALCEALNEDAELRALYLDYMNLDVALSAAAEIADNGTGRIATRTRLPAPSWRWLAAAAACVALIISVVLPGFRDSSPARPDVAFSSAQIAVARLSVRPTSTLPGWISPTASLLDERRFPE
ncbi:MAG: hypothetical protein PHC88_05055 [Terrimicrobiaceae bacterium]|nr:hypothetical protein [Terrimicrobiaceae bacterium]